MNQIVLQEPGRFVAAATEEPRPGEGEVLVRVHRIGVCGTDLHAFRGRQPFFSYPRILGHELAVEVVDASQAGGALRPGEICAVEPYLQCGRCIACRRGRPNCCAHLRVLGVHCDGGMRPWLCVPAEKLHPAGSLPVDEVALVEALAIGAHAVERAVVEPEEYVLVVGAGPIGLATLQFVQDAGARIAVLDVNERRLDYCREHFRLAGTVGAAENVEARLRELGGGDLPTAVFDATGHAGSMQAAFQRAAPGGRVVFVGLVQGELSFNDPEFHRKELTLLASRNALGSTFRGIIERMQAGRIDLRPWITHRLALSDVVGQFGDLAGDPKLIKAMVSAI